MLRLTETQEEAEEPRGESLWEAAGAPWVGSGGRELLVSSWRGSGWSFQARRGLSNCRLCATAVSYAEANHADALQDAGLLVSLPKVTARPTTAARCSW